MENTFTKIEKMGKVIYEKNSWFHEVEDNQNGPGEQNIMSKAVKYPLNLIIKIGGHYGRG